MGDALGEVDRLRFGEMEGGIRRIGMKDEGAWSWTVGRICWARLVSYGKQLALDETHQTEELGHRD